MVRQLLAAGLIDELSLLVHPVAARHGERLFDEGEPMYPLTLLRSETFPTGVVRLTYAPSEFPAAKTYDDVTDKVPGAEATADPHGPQRASSPPPRTDSSLRSSHSSGKNR